MFGNIAVLVTYASAFISYIVMFAEVGERWWKGFVPVYSSWRLSRALGFNIAFSIACTLADALSRLAILSVYFLPAALENLVVYIAITAVIAIVEGIVFVKWAKELGFSALWGGALLFGPLVFFFVTAATVLVRKASSKASRIVLGSLFACLSALLGVIALASIRLVSGGGMLLAGIAVASVCACISLWRTKATTGIYAAVTSTIAAVIAVAGIANSAHVAAIEAANEKAYNDWEASITHPEPVTEEEAEEAFLEEMERELENVDVNKAFRTAYNKRATADFDCYISNNASMKVIARAGDVLITDEEMEAYNEELSEAQPHILFSIMPGNSSTLRGDTLPLDEQCTTWELRDMSFGPFSASEYFTQHPERKTYASTIELSGETYASITVEEEDSATVMIYIPCSEHGGECYTVVAKDLPATIALAQDRIVKK